MLDTYPVDTIELLGSYLARHVESGVEVNGNRRSVKSSIPILCRHLIAEGFPPEGRVHVIRKALRGSGVTPIFKRDRTLGAWAAVDCVESDETGLRFGKHRPFPDSLQRRGSDQAPEVPQSTPESQTALTVQDRASKIAA